MTNSTPSRRGTFSRLTVIQKIDHDQKVDDSTKLEFKIQPERIRFIAYLFFWSMCALAITLTNTLVAPMLLEGPKDGNSCPPFETGKGFDIKTDSHLIRAFGYNNICSNWDYSPSREITAAYYPIFEYCLLFYVIADYINVVLHYKKGLVSKRCYQTFKICFPLLLVFSAWFRLIFVGIAYINVSAHTFGFLTLQLVLIAIACLNVWFVVESKLEYSMLCGHTRLVSLIYLACNLSISFVKIYLTTYFVITGGGYPSWAKTTSPALGAPPGKLIDYIWMGFNALLPAIFAYVRSQVERPLEITIDFKPHEREKQSVARGNGKVWSGQEQVGDNLVC